MRKNNKKKNSVKMLVLKGIFIIVSFCLVVLYEVVSWNQTTEKIEASNRNLSPIEKTIRNACMRTDFSSYGVDTANDQTIIVLQDSMLLKENDYCMEMYNVLKALGNINTSKVIVGIKRYAPNEYGNYENKYIFFGEWSRETLSRINWNNISIENIKTISSFWEIRK